MKARAEAGPEPIYDNESFEGFTSLSSSPKTFKSSLDGNSDDNKQELKNVSRKLNGFLNNGVVTRKLSPTRQNSTEIPDEPFSQKIFQPLHFNTNEVLDETPAILKSLNSGSGRGPDTFVYHSSRKPTSLSQNDDPCKTFLITSGKSFVKRKNSLNQILAVNGVGNKETPYQDDSNEYLSYVIQKADESENGKMNEEICASSDSSDHNKLESTDEVDHISSCESHSKRQQNADKVSEENLCKNNVKESEICDKKMQCRGEDTTDDTAVLSFDRTIAGKKEQAFAKLQDELEKAHQELKLKDEEVTRLTRIREDVERELEELTASLFQEAHKMVSKAKEKQAAAEKSLKESQMKVEVLTAEVVALKTLVLTSTPSRPNPHLHPQIGKEDSAGGVNLFTRKHRRSPSHFNLKYGRENSPPESPVRDEQNSIQNPVSAGYETRDSTEVDPTVHKEFLNWTLTCKLDKTDPFIDRIYREDINLCLDFCNRELAEEVQKAIESRNIFIEALTDKSKTIFPRKCALLEVTRQCHYRMKLGDQDTWYNISQMCRNRIIAVCDFVNYLRYIELGLVKSSAHDMYWEIMRLRKEMVLARLGLSLPSS